MMGSRAILTLAAILLLAGCGRKGALIPPEALVPAAVQDLRVQQSGEEFRITWSAPSREKGGRPLRDLSSFQLFRRTIAGDGTDCSSCPDSWKLLANMDLDKPAEFKKSGSTFIQIDKPAGNSKGEQYRIVALSRSGGVSSPSLSSIKKFHPPLAAPAIKGEVIPGSIRIDFTPPQTAGDVVGYNIYKRSEKEDSPLLPFNPAPIKGAAWEDRQLEYGKAYRYSATALAEKEGEIVESGRSTEIEILFTLPELR